MSKRIIIIFVCLLLVAVPIILFSAVFVVRDVDVINNGSDFAYDSDKIVKDSRIANGTSMFVLSEKNSIHNIELKNPHIKVVNIEKIAPNKVVINIVRRMPVVAIKITDTSKYAIIDRELRVIDIADNLVDYNVVEYKGITLDISKDADLTREMINVPTNKMAGYLIDEVIKGFEMVGFANQSLPTMVKAVNINASDNKNFVVALKNGAIMEIPLKSSDKNVKVRNMVFGAFDKFRSDFDIHKNDVDYFKDKIYYFNPNAGENNAGGWDVRVR